MQTTQDQKDIDINGYITYFDVPMTKVGVFPYLGRTISPELEPDRVYMVLRPEEELTNSETLKSLENIPFVIDHTMLGEGFTPAEDKGIEGTTGTNVKVNGDLITNDLTAYTDRCKAAIDNGKRDLSMGYRCRYELTPGEFRGQHYDAIQRDIRFNHVALVDEGRMGSECRVTDNSITYDSLDLEIKEQNKETKMADLKEELKEEIKEELLNGEEEITEEKTEVKDEEKPACDEDTDKRKLIDEVGGILKSAGLDDELIRTVLKKMEEASYNPSEKGANDGSGNGEEITEEKSEGLSMDEAVKYFAKRDSIVERIKPIIGDNANYKSMTIEEVVNYACDKLDIPSSLKGLEGYLSAEAKHKKVYVTVAKDSAFKFDKDEKSAELKDYINGK